MLTEINIKNVVGLNTRGWKKLRADGGPCPRLMLVGEGRGGGAYEFLTGLMHAVCRENGYRRYGAWGQERDMLSLLSAPVGGHFAFRTESGKQGGMRLTNPSWRRKDWEFGEGAGDSEPYVAGIEGAWPTGKPRPKPVKMFLAAYGRGHRSAWPASTGYSNPLEGNEGYPVGYAADSYYPVGATRSWSVPPVGCLSRPFDRLRESLERERIKDHLQKHEPGSLDALNKTLRAVKFAQELLLVEFRLKVSVEWPKQVGSVRRRLLFESTLAPDHRYREYAAFDTERLLPNRMMVPLQVMLDLGFHMIEQGLDPWTSPGLVLFDTVDPQTIERVLARFRGICAWSSVPDVRSPDFSRRLLEQAGAISIADDGQVKILKHLRDLWLQAT